MFSLGYYFFKSGCCVYMGAEDDMSCDREQWPIVWVNIVLNTCNFAMPSDP